VQGHFNYYAVPGNTASLSLFRHRLLVLWWHGFASSAGFPSEKSGRLMQLLFQGLLSVHSRYRLQGRGVA